MVDGNPLPNAGRWPLVVLVAITLAGLALRLTNTFESLWLDELHTGWVVKDGWSEVAWRAQIGNQSPLWFYAVKAITTIAGESEFSLRLLSLVAGTALIPVAYWLVMLFAKTQADGNHCSPFKSELPAILAAGLVAVDPNCIFYATEARPYACLQLVAAIQLGLFWQVLIQPTARQRLAWIALTALEFHLHYTGVLILAGELIALLAYYVLARRTVPYRPWRALFDWQVAVMLCLPALPHVLQVAQRRELWQSMSETPRLAELWRLFPLQGLFVVIVVACGCAIAMRWLKGVTDKPAPDKSLALVLAWFLIPLLAAFLAAHFDLARVFLPRYLIALAIGPLILTALFLCRVPWRWLQGAIAFGVFAFAVHDGQIIQQLRYDGRAVGDRDEDWRGAIAWLSRHNEQKHWPVHIQAGLLEERDRLYREDHQSDDEWERQLAQRRAYLSCPLFSLYSADVSLDQAVPQSMQGQLRGQVDPANPDGLWFVVRSPSPALPKLKIYDLAAPPQSFGNVHVGRYRRQSLPQR